MSLAVLSIEESSKAIIFNMAANGIIRIVKNNPNNVTTFRKDDLRNHRFKHNLVRGYLSDWLEYYPFRAALSGVKKKKLTKDEVEMIIQKAVYDHKHMKLSLHPESKAGHEIQKIFGLLEELDGKKNRGLYVDHAPNRVLDPNDTTKKDLADALGVADLFVIIASNELSREMDNKERSMHIEELRQLARESRALTRASRKRP
jgi:AbiV family abortive infection protein